MNPDSTWWYANTGSTWTNSSTISTNAIVYNSGPYTVQWTAIPAEHKIKEQVGNGKPPPATIAAPQMQALPAVGSLVFVQHKKWERTGIVTATGSTHNKPWFELDHSVVVPLHTVEWMAL